MDLETLQRTLVQRLESDRRYGVTHLSPAAAAFDLSFLTDMQRHAKPAADETAAVPVKPPVMGGIAAAASKPVTPSPTVAKPAGRGALFEVEAATAIPGGVNVSPPNEAPSTLPREERVKTLTVLAGRVAGCVRCKELAETRNKTVFGAGNPSAAILFLGEAPGADEDATGVPFVGKAGQLLDKIIAACRLTRDDIYIANILKCRPPGNRNPAPQEAANCREYLSAQIATVDPDYIVCWGRVAAENLLGTKEAIGKLRKRMFRYGRAKVAATYHPSYLLRNPAAKKDVWDDMKWLFADMGVDLDAGRK